MRNQNIACILASTNTKLMDLRLKEIRLLLNCFPSLRRQALGTVSYVMGCQFSEDFTLSDQSGPCLTWLSKGFKKHYMQFGLSPFFFYSRGQQWAIVTMACLSNYQNELIRKNPLTWAQWTTKWRVRSTVVERVWKWACVLVHHMPNWQSLMSSC